MTSQEAFCVAAGEESAPLLYGPKAQVRKALEANRIRYTYIVAYGLASYWANGLGELGQRNRVPPAPTGQNKVSYYGSGRTKCERYAPPIPCVSHTHPPARVDIVLALITEYPYASLAFLHPDPACNRESP